MIDMFYYNWQVRDDWFHWCENLSTEELAKKRIGGMGSILKTLFHIIDGEQLWINQMNNTPVIQKNIDTILTLQDVKDFSHSTKSVVENFILSWEKEKEDRLLHIIKKDGTVLSFTYGKVIRHLISHEIHHIGQLSIWARELDRKPVNSDLIIRNYI